jgi:hypothetical protein
VSSVISDSFVVSGVSPLNAAVIRDRCKYAWAEGEKEQFLAAVPALATVFEEHFEVKEDDFEAARIPRNNEDRDNLPVHRRRALMLHAPHVVAALRDQAERSDK